MNNISKYVVTVVAGALLLSAMPTFAEVTAGVKVDMQANVKKMHDNMVAKISQIKDKKKMEAANNIVKQSAHVNKVWTDHFNAVLDHLGNVVTKISSRTSKASANGKDVTAVNVAIQRATDAIGVARNAVSVQAGKTYAVDTTSITGSTTSVAGQNGLISKLRIQFKMMKDLVMKDLLVLRDVQIKNAKTSVEDALKALQQIPGVDKEPTIKTNNQ